MSSSLPPPKVYLPNSLRFPKLLAHLEGTADLVVDLDVGADTAVALLIARWVRLMLSSLGGGASLSTML
jgi:hypothetical protein